MVHLVRASTVFMVGDAIDQSPTKSQWILKFLAGGVGIGTIADLVLLAFRSSHKIP